MKAKSQQRFKKFQLDIKDFKILQQLESGGFGSVFSVQNTQTGDILAAKSIINHSDEDKYKLMINREIGIMAKCQHPTIIKFHGYSLCDFNNQKNALIFMDLAKNGSLASFLQKAKKGLLNQVYDNTARQIILIGISYGMMHLHRHKIMHRDLKPGNILIDDNLHPHITDFGLSKTYNGSNSASQSQQCGTSIYMAPEIIEGTHYSSKADVYSFGILMYEVVTELTPYPLFEKGKMSSFQFTNKVVNENLRPQFTVKVKKHLQKLIEKCWSKNPSQRPTFEEIFKKLAYNEDSEEDEVISTDEDEDDDENKYYLDDVDVEEVLLYADEIDSVEPPATESASIDQSKIAEIVESLILPLKKENEQLKKQIEQIQIEKDEMKTRISLLEKALFSAKTSSSSSTSSSSLQSIEPAKNVNTHITIKKFNDLPLKEQQSIVENLCNGQMKQYFSVINNLLLLLIKFIKTNDSQIISMNSNDSQQFVNEIKKEEMIQINSSATEKLFILNVLNSPDLNSIIMQFKFILFEVKFNTQNFDKIYEILVNKKRNNMIFDIGICIDDEEFTSLFFNGRTAINSLKFSPSVKIINSDGFFKSGSFCGCSNLTSVKLPPSLTFIGSSSFSECISLTEIKIPPSVTQIWDAAFNKCTALKRVVFEDMANSNLNNIGAFAFALCSSLDEICFPSSVKKIGPQAFANCTSLVKISILGNIKEIDNNSFYGCSSLETVEVPLSFTQNTFGNGVFPQNVNINTI